MHVAVDPRSRAVLAFLEGAGYGKADEKAGRTHLASLVEAETEQSQELHQVVFGQACWKEEEKGTWMLHSTVARPSQLELARDTKCNQKALHNDLVLSRMQSAEQSTAGVLSHVQQALGGSMGSTKEKIQKQISNTQRRRRETRQIANGRFFQGRFHGLPPHHLVELPWE